MINWGLAGCGWVAGDFAEGLRHVPDARLGAVCARETAPAFAARFGVPRHYRTVGELAADPEIDVVYVSTPNSLHAEHCEQVLEAGKPVVCEKPFALNAQEARRIAELARERGLFCMEAMWMRFLPATRRACELVASGAIGDVRMVSGNFGHCPPYDLEGRFFNPALGGGAMLDVGVYSLSLAVMLLGPPASVASAAAIGPSGVDEQSGALLVYPDGNLAVAVASLRTFLPTEAVISGTEGEIRLGPLYRPEHLSLRRFAPAAPAAAQSPWRQRARAIPGLKIAVRGARRARRALRPGPSERIPFEGNGFNYEAAEVNRCLTAGLTESPLMPLDESVQVMEAVDAARREWAQAA